MRKIQIDTNYILIELSKEIIPYVYSIKNKSGLSRVYLFILYNNTDNTLLFKNVKSSLQPLLAFKPAFNTAVPYREE